MKKTTINLVLEGTRLAMGFGIGLFVRSISDNLARDKTKLQKAGYWIGGMCTALAIGHSVDSYIDKAKVITGVSNPDGTPSKEFMDEFAEFVERNINK